MIENYFSTAAMALETAVTLFLTTFFLLKRRKQSVGCYIGVFLGLLVYMEAYQFAMRFHGPKIWFFGGLVEILAFVLLITVMTEGCFWRSYCSDTGGNPARLAGAGTPVSYGSSCDPDTDWLYTGPDSGYMCLDIRCGFAFVCDCISRDAPGIFERI